MTHEVSPQHAIFGHLGTRLSVEERIVLDIFNKFLVNILIDILINIFESIVKSVNK